MIRKLINNISGKSKISEMELKQKEAEEQLQLLKEAADQALKDAQDQLALIMKATEISKKEAKNSKAEAKKAKSDESKAKSSPKDRASAREEPWVGVLETHVNKDNIRNGFFELDWNEYFIKQLIHEGYGFESDTEESIVDRWFKELCLEIATENDIDMTDRGAGYLNVKPLADNKSEIG